MKQVHGIWLPASETYLLPFLKRSPKVGGKATYQFTKLARALPCIRDYRHALDIGAHVGLWSRVMALLFQRLTAFEPMGEPCRCFVRNVLDDPGRCDVGLHQTALGATTGRARMQHDPSSTMMTSVIPEGDDATVPMTRLDAYGLHDVDFIKIDVEGYEAEVIAGAEDTIRTWRPCIVVEQKHNCDAMLLLKRWGFICKWEIVHDYCWAWPIKSRDMVSDHSST